MARRAVVAGKKPMVADTKPRAMAPIEPVLELDDIQGIAAPGFLKPHHALVYLRLPEAIAQLITIREHLASMVSAGAIAWRQNLRNIDRQARRRSHAARQRPLARRDRRLDAAGHT